MVFGIGFVFAAPLFFMFSSAINNSLIIINLLTAKINL